MNQTVQQSTEAKTAPFAFFLLALYTISVLVRPHEFSIETADYQFIRFFAIASLVFLLITLRPIRFPPQLAMLILLLPLIMLSAFFNGWGTGGFEQSQRLLVSSIIPFFLFCNLVATPKRQRILMLICIISALVMVANGHIQQASFDGTFGIGIGGSTTVADDEMRITYLGFFNDPNDVGMFLVMNIPFVAYFYSRSQFYTKIMMACAGIALVYGIYMTGSRGTLLSAIGVAAAYFIIRRASTMLIIFLAVFAPFAGTLITSFGGLGAGDGSVEGRLDAWYAGIGMLLGNPIFGVGMGNFVEEHIRVAHNSYIHVAAELGVLGYSLWGGVLTLNMLASYRLVRQTAASNRDNTDTDSSNLLEEELLLNRALFFSMIGFMIAAFFLSRNYVLTMFIFLGMQTATLLRIADIKQDIQIHFDFKSIVRAAGISWIIIIAVYASLKIGL